MRRTPLALRSQLLPRLLSWASSHGLDPAALARRCGLPSTPGLEQEPLVPLEALRSLGATVSAELRDPLLGLHLAQHLEPADYGALGLLGRSTGSLGEALEMFVKYSGALNAVWSVKLEPQLTGARVRQRIPREPECLGATGNIYFACGLVVLARRLVGPATAPRRAWLAHSGPVEPEVARFLGCPVEYGRAENGLEVAQSVLSLRLSTADPVVGDWLERQVLHDARAASGGPDPLAEVRRIVRESLPTLVPLRAAAQALASSPRSLQRRLADENTNYNKEAGRVRRELALELLGAGLPLGEISYRCGFSDTRAFSRAFKRWTGSPPGTMRQVRQPTDRSR